MPEKTNISLIKIETFLVVELKIAFEKWIKKLHDGKKL